MDNTENSYIPIHLPLNKSYDLRKSSTSITIKEVAVSPGVKLWQSALEKLRSHAAASDPWKDFNMDLLPTCSAIRHRFSAIKKKWIKDEIIVKLEQVPFDRGAMRECFRMKKVSPGGDWSTASNYVAKRYISSVKSSVYMDDVRLQMEAKLWAEEFNRQDPPKKVDVFQMSVMEILHTYPVGPLTPPNSRRRGSFSSPSSSTTQESLPTSTFYHIERFMDGEYRKYNSNSGFVDSKPRNTPQAFSHFTFERSGHRILVVDIQGVGDLYTDPQIHTSDGLGYNEGNLGVRGMSLFFHSHRCNPLCLWLGLTPFDLSSHELAELLDAPAVQFESDDEDDDATSEASDEHNISTSPLDGYQPTKFPPTPFHLHPRKRSLSFGVFPLNTSYNTNSLKGNRRLFGPTLVRDHEFLSTPRFRTLSGSANCFLSSSTTADYARSSLKPELAIHSAYGEGSDSRLHQRQVSRDSGIAFYSNAIMRPPVRRISSTTSDDQSDSLGEFFDESPLPPFADVFQEVYSGFACALDDGADFTVPPAPAPTGEPRCRQIQRSHRTSSESSDIDELEAVRLASHSLHHILHETQKPTSAAHPSNLDQEIGQSILGQMHHELARLHEAGRFLKRPGGWSKTGIGRLFPDPPPSGADLEEERTSTLSAAPDTTISWESVIFHEHQAAQLGCLEALIIMAHYYLGLPTQLLSECPIKARDDDLGLGVDYLWRSSEGGDRRCMILLARYLDASVFFSGENNSDPLDRSSLKSALNLTTTPIEDFFVLLGHKSFPIPSAAVASGSPGPWAEAAMWYKRAVEHARQALPGSPATTDEGCDAEGLYDAAEDLWPVHRLLARMAEMYSVGGFGLPKNCQIAGDLFNEAAESVMQQMNGRLASRYFELAEESYSNAE